MKIKNVLEKTILLFFVIIFFFLFFIFNTFLSFYYLIFPKRYRYEIKNRWTIFKHIWEFIDSPE